jgi:hypothetical protein
MQVMQLQAELDTERSRRVGINVSASAHSPAEHVNPFRKGLSRASTSPVLTGKGVAPNSPPPAQKFGRQATDFRGATDPEAFSLVSRGMGDISERGLRDPVLEGVVTMAQLETAYQA